MPYWDERVVEMAKQYPDVKVDKFHIDILTAHFVQRPDFFDVVVGSNLFGDILSALCPASPPTPHPTPPAPAPFAVRTGARLGARHRRQRDRQPDWPDLVRCHDARPPGLPRGTRRGDAGH